MTDETAYTIERLTTTGFWAPLRESTERTGFRMKPVPYPSRDDAAAAIVDMVAAGWSPGRLRIVAPQLRLV